MHAAAVHKPVVVDGALGPLGRRNGGAKVCKETDVDRESERERERETQQKKKKRKMKSVLVLCLNLFGPNQSHSISGGEC